MRFLSFSSWLWLFWWRSSATSWKTSLFTQKCKNWIFFFYFFSSKIIRNATLFSIVFYSWSLSLTVLTLKTHFAFFSNANFITFILISALLFIWKCLRIYISVQQDWYIQHLTQRYKQDSSKLSQTDLLLTVDLLDSAWVTLHLEEKLLITLSPDLVDIISSF